jgi:hypothetical protein
MTFQTERYFQAIDSPGGEPGAPKKEPGATLAAPGSLQCFSLFMEVKNPATAGGSGLSGAAETDAHLAAVHQHRHPPVSRDEALHLLHGLGILNDIPIDDL